MPKLIDEYYVKKVPCKDGLEYVAFQLEFCRTKSSEAIENLQKAAQENDYWKRQLNAIADVYARLKKETVEGIPQ
jgi:hypothetical protein